MTPDQGKQVAENIKAAGHTLIGYITEHGFVRETFFRVLYHGMGSIKGGPRSQAIIDQLKRDGFYPPNGKEKVAYATSPKP